MKVLVNGCFGGYGYSKEFVEYCKLNGIDKMGRDNQEMIALAESFGGNISGDYARLYVEEIEDGLDYYVDEYDGNESIHTFLPVTVEELAMGLSKNKLELLNYTSNIQIV